MKKALIVGQTVYLNPYDRGNREVQEGIISKIGKKYFEIEGFHRDRFFIDTMAGRFIFQSRKSWMKQNKISFGEN
jgi:hypothetical protein